ncbi:glycosyltransferase [Thiorhodococcus mannitoliphagus]|uniref:Glycosyltransferase n=1 Tax=Thiorhodococcus mannitoliphagus TaxID=329406 RepID=A0A6P1DMW0_9GAMM|nr:glycosyltransferase [Thiorhodococcus mannitoliphagus]NEX19378.1 glycosyltransferase [Thiorhodococcus mannitoliphagus]
MSDPSTLQMVASKALGGAERWFIRFSQALADCGAAAQLAIRDGSALDGMDLGGLPVHTLPYRTTWDPWSRRATTRLIQQLRPDIVQTYMGRATRLTHLPLGERPVHVSRLGGYYALGPYRHAHAWIGNTKGLCDWMVRQGLPAERIYHIYNFADAARPVAPEAVAERRQAHGIPEDAWVLLTLGRFVAVKGQAYLIEALSRLPERIADRPLRLVMVGDGPLGPKLQAQAEQLGQSHRILWAGWQPDPAPYLQMADLVVFPSLDAETLGNVILEAWAWGKPLVTARFRGARELARHGEDAFCVSCEDAIGLASGIRQTLSDPALMVSMVSRGRERVEREFGRQAIMDRYLELYRCLAG